MALVLTDKLTKLLAVLLLTSMFAAAFLSMKDDSLTFDELAHIPAGYSYLTQQDYRINPEHPPLAKDLAAFPLLFLNLNFPSQSQNWLQEEQAPPWWAQFNLGTEFLYQSGNNPQDIIIWSRLPMILLLMVLGWFTFTWARHLEGNKAALLALGLFAFSPTLLAHGRLVTTDIAAALGAVLAMFFWIHFLKEPTKKHIFIAGIAFGVAMLLKFSLVLLIPVFGVLTILYPLLHGFSWKKLFSFIGKAVIAGIVGMILVIWPVYAWHTANYPAPNQLRDTIADLSPSEILPHEQIVIEMTKQPLLRPLAQYFRGVSMALQRSSFGNTTYFRGQVSADAFPLYFPTLYLLKTPLALQLLTLLGLAGILFALFRKGLAAWIREHFAFFAIFLFLAVYWGFAVTGNLNIGVRHLLPILPFVYVLTAWGILYLSSLLPYKKAFVGVVGILLLWYAGSALSAFPHYISYYNELAGGTDNGYKIAVDSNYDWGQDFHRLVTYVEEHSIKKIHLDYFGGENPAYWLGQRYTKLNPNNPPTEGWIAVSANQLMGGIAEPAKGFDQETDYYNWLSSKEPVAKAGKSIFIYHVD
tara:strand:- start:5321 stop:7069 length:1749 start_codon:yes stop_codon:yes gene_type:complete